MTPSKTVIPLLAVIALLYPGLALANNSQVDADATLVLQFLDDFFNQGNIDVVDDVVSPDYVQHNAAVPDGLDALKALGPVPNANGKLPTKKVILRFASQGGLVAVHSRVADNDPDDDADVPDIAFVDIFRVADGKVMEHWDMIQMVVVWNASGDLGSPAMWAPDPPTTSPAALVEAQAATTGDPDVHAAVIRTVYQRVYNQGRQDLVDRLYADSFQQHASYIEADRQGVRNFVAELPKESQFTPKRIIAQGDLVVVQSQWTTRKEQRGSDFCGWNIGDIFRFDTDGKIAEQWSVKARVACVSVNASTPF